MTAKEIGKRIKDYRKEKGLTQKELASLIDCADITLSEYERGKYLPKIDMRVKIANALGVAYSDLFLDSVPESYESPEDFQKRWNEITQSKGPSTYNIKQSRSADGSVKTSVTFSFEADGLSESEKNELQNYYNFIKYKRQSSPE